MTKGDRIVDGAADRLEELGDRAAGNDGAAARLAAPLADDAAFLRKLKPSLMAARARGDAPKNANPATTPRAPTGPQIGKRPTGKPKGPNPFLVAGAAFALGILLAKVVDWRGHAHPRD